MFGVAAFAFMHAIASAVSRIFFCEPYLLLSQTQFVLYKVDINIALTICRAFLLGLSLNTAWQHMYLDKL